MNTYIDSLYSELMELEIERDQLRFRADDIQDEIDSLRDVIDQEERRGF